MTVKQLAEIFKAKDRARMLRGEEQPRQEPFVNGLRRCRLGLL
jgi:hypothetical protein